jgi:hypothetical protein
MIGIAGEFVEGKAKNLQTQRTRRTESAEQKRLITLNLRWLFNKCLHTEHAASGFFELGGVDHYGCQAFLSQNLLNVLT